MCIGFGVVLVVVNLAALFVLLMLHLSVLAGRQLAAVRRAIIAHFLVDFPLIVLDVRSFTRRKLPGFDSISNTLLLAILARIHTHPLRMTGISVVKGRPIAVVLARKVLMRNLR